MLESISLSTHEIVDTELRYGAHNYAPLPVVLARGQGAYVWDIDGKCYLDMMSAYSALSHGHSHPRIVDALCEQARLLTVTSRAFYTDRLGQFLKRACTLTGFARGLPMNTGAEAVETGIKAARKWAYTVKGVTQDQAEIIACSGNFHGRTLGAISMSTVPQYRFGFGPLVPGFKIIRYGDIGAFKAAITPNTAAFLVEPIQGEGGIIVPPTGYLRACYEICQAKRVLFICDEVQTGLGRTGKLLAAQHEDIQPDAVILGKALGGGILPISLLLSSNEVMDVFTPGDHGSTFGGNPLAATVADTALQVLIDDHLIERAAVMGEYFIAELQKIASPLIKDIRGRGLLIGVEIDSCYSAHEICLQLLQHGILTKETHATVIRFAPPLIITQAQIDTTVSALKTVLAEVIG